MEIDLTQIEKKRSQNDLAQNVREKAHAGANFSLARGGDTISHVTIWIGDGRDRKERKISLTTPQGTFLYHLPFPNADSLSIADIMGKAGINEELAPEILDIVELLEKYGVIEIQ